MQDPFSQTTLMSDKETSNNDWLGTKIMTWTFFVFGEMALEQGGKSVVVPLFFLTIRLPCGPRVEKHNLLSIFLE